MWTTSLLALVIVSIACLGGVFSGAFKDNTLQRIGMGVVAIGCCGRIWQLWLADASDGLVVLYAGIAIYAIGTASKVIVFHGRSRGWRVVLDVDRWLFDRKTAADRFDSRPHHHV